MRIHVVSLNYAPEKSGIAPYATGLATGLARRGHQVLVSTGLPHYPQWRVDPADRAPSRTPTSIDGVLVQRFSHYVPRTPTLRRRVAFESSFGIRVVSRRWSRTDLILTISPSLITSALVIARARAMGIPVGLIVQDFYGLGVTETGALTGTLAKGAAKFEKAVFDAATGIAVIHDSFSNTAVAMGVDRDRVTTIRNWSHIESSGTVDPRDVRLEQGWSPDERIVLHSGNMGVKQGLENVIAAARLADERGTNIRFVLMGDGNQRAMLQAQAEGVRRIEFKEQVADHEYRHILAAADVLLVNERPGVVEMALPSKLTSYFVAGRAILAATEPTGVTAKEVRASGAGLVVDAGDPSALLDAAIHLADDPTLNGELASTGAEYASRLLGADTALDHYEAWCSHLLGVHASRPALAGGQ